MSLIIEIFGETGRTLELGPNTVVTLRPGDAKINVGEQERKMPPEIELLFGVIGILFANSAGNVIEVDPQGIGLFTLPMKGGGTMTTNAYSQTIGETEAHRIGLVWYLEPESEFDYRIRDTSTVVNVRATNRDINRAWILSD